AIDERVDRGMQRGRVGEQRRDVLEDDAGLREVGDVADAGLQVGFGHGPFCTPLVRAGASGRNQIGFRAMLSLRVSKWRFGPDGFPVPPTVAICCPWRTRAPRSVRFSRLWA